MHNYQIKLRPLTTGNTPEEAARNVRDAIEEWLAAARAMGRKIPEPDWTDKTESSG